MLFKFASYLLGTNNEESKPDQQQQLNIESNENQDTLIETKENSNLINKEEEKESSTTELNSNKTEDLIQDDYMYDEQLINCSKLNSNNLQTDLVKDDQLCDQLEEDDCEEDQWIYITPIKRKNEDEKEISEEDEFTSEQEEEEENCSLINEKILSKENDVPKQEKIVEKEQFNFYDYFNNKNSSLVTVEEEHCSPVKSSKLDSSVKPIYKEVNDYKLQQQQLNRMEQSWIIHPPACFQFENTFLLEEDPLTNHYIENPQLSVMASIDKENSASSLTNSSNSAKNLSTRILADRNLNNIANNQTKEKTSIASRKSMRKRANSTRKSNKKQQNKKQSPSKKTDSLAQQNENLPVVEQVATVEKTTEINEEKQVLNDRIEKQLLAHYLTVNPNRINSITTSNSIATSSSSNGSTHQSTNHPHNHYAHLHFISNSNNVANANSTNSNIENKKGSKSLRRNNKVALKRDNLSNKPFTLHRKLC